MSKEVAAMTRARAYLGVLVVLTLSGSSWAGPAKHDAQEVIDVLGVGPGHVVADVGCGNGWLSAPVAAAVGPAGRVYAVELGESDLDEVRARGLSNVVPVLSVPDDVSLPAGSLDVAFLHDVADHVDKDVRPAFYASIARALKPTGRLVIFGHHGHAPRHLEELRRYAFVPEDEQALGKLSSAELEARFKDGIRFRHGASDDDGPLLAEQIERILDAYHEGGMFDGAVLVAVHGEVVYREGFGLANREWERPNAPDTRFSIASLGKAFTAAIVLQLVDEGRVELTDPVAKHLSSLRRDLAERITIHHLLSHTSGLPREPAEWPRRGYRDPYTMAELVAFANELELASEPGAAFRYSNIGYNLLGALIEEVTGRPFAEELRGRILDRAAMQDTGLALASPVVERRAAGYDRLPLGEYVNARYQDQSFATGAGGMVSTVDDLYRWDRLLYDESFLSAEARAAMFTAGAGGAGYGWAIGGYVKQGDPERRKLCLGFGGTSGFAAAITRLLDDRHLIVLLGNIRQVPQQRLINDLTNLILGFDVSPPAGSVATDLFRAILTEGVAEGVALFRRGDDGLPSEAEVNSAGYAYLHAGRHEEALALFRFNVAVFPDSANTYDSLGEAQLRAGERELAIQNYRRSLELDPGNDNARTILRGLRPGVR